VTYRLDRKQQAARDLAYTYLDHWSAPNRVALASAPSFYGSSLIFHGRTRSLASVMAEKRRFAERWPDRTYRYRPETTQVLCESGGARCTVRSLFNFSAAGRDPVRRSAGTGDHELVVSFSGSRPVIVSENSRVLRRGAVPRVALARFASSPDQARPLEESLQAHDPEPDEVAPAADPGDAALTACREAIANAARPYGGIRVVLANAEPTATGGIIRRLSFDARVEYRHEVRESRVTCRFREDGQVVAVE
jgi:hypothetical protein